MRKLYFKNDRKILLKIDQQEVALKELLIFFLCGKLVPLFGNKQLKGIYLTQELRDIEFAFDPKVLYFNTVKK